MLQTDVLEGGAIVDSALTTLVLLSAVVAVGGRLKMLIGAVLAMPALFGEWLSYWRPDLPVFRATGLLFLGFVVVQFLR